MENKAAALCIKFSIPACMAIMFAAYAVLAHQVPRFATSLQKLRRPYLATGKVLLVCWSSFSIVPGLDGACLQVLSGPLGPQGISAALSCLILLTLLFFGVYGALFLRALTADGYPSSRNPHAMLT